MGNRQISTKVQSGETLSLYANMYNCSEQAIIAANKGTIGANGKLKEGSDIVIPIGQPPKDTQPNGSFLQKKVQSFGDEVENAKIVLFNEKLKPDEREILEQHYIYLKNMQKARQSSVEIKIINGDHYSFTMKKDVTLKEFREMFLQRCTTNFMDYCQRTGQSDFVSGTGHTYPSEDEIILKKGTSFDVASVEFCDQGFKTEWKNVKTKDGRFENVLKRF